MLATPHLVEAMTRIAAEYAEMPGLKLTAGQVQRLCGLQGELCLAALAVLLRQGFLTKSSGGSYLRLRS
jgi:hypothetical protein